MTLARVSHIDTVLSIPATHLTLSDRAGTMRRGGIFARCVGVVSLLAICRRFYVCIIQPYYICNKQLEIPNN
jgi:hypothetical protein